MSRRVAPLATCKIANEYATTRMVEQNKLGSNPVPRTISAGFVWVSLQKGTFRRLFFRRLTRRLGFFAVFGGMNSSLGETARGRRRRRAESP